MLQKALIVISASVFAALLIFGLFALSPEYNYCAGHGGQHFKADSEAPADHTEIENPTTLRLLRSCGGIYVSHNADAMTGAATVMLTIATFLLGWLALDQKRTSQAQLRAYVGVKSRLCIIKSGILQIEFKIENRGQTPAYNVRSICDGWVDKVEGTRKADLSDEDEIPTCVGPGDNFSLFAQVDYTAEDIIFVRDETKTIKGEVEIEYYDVFKKKRTTKGSYELNGARRFDDQEDRRMYLASYFSD